MNFGHLIIGIIFVLGIFSVISIFDQLNPTGDFTYGQAGRGRYYAAGGWVQFEIKEACEYVGAKSFDPSQSFYNKMGGIMAICFYSNPDDKNDRVAVPLIQWVTPTPVPGQFNPIP